MSNSDADPVIEREQITTFVAKRVDGLILSILDEYDEVLWTDLTRRVPSSPPATSWEWARSR